MGGGAGHTCEIRARLSPINYNPGTGPARPLATPKPVASVQLNLLSLQCPLPLHWAPRWAGLEPGKLMPMDATGQRKAEATPPVPVSPALNAQYRAGTSSTSQPTNARSTGPAVGQALGLRGWDGRVGTGGLSARYHHAETEWPAHASLGLRRMEDSQLVGKPGGGEAEAGGGPCAPPQLPQRHKPAAQRTEDLCPQLETGGLEPRQAGWGCSSTRSDTALPSANAVHWSVVGRPWRLSGEKKSACHCR